jgi:CheY-like chemotaxis protein
VEDTGIGIPEDQQDQIFTLFGRLDGNQMLNPQGCGLGLSISTILLQKLGGDCIRVTSRTGCGSTFTFEVSISQGEQSHLSYVLEDVAEAPDEYLTFIRGIQLCSAQNAYVSSADVLIVDDVSFNRLVAKKMVEAFGLKCAEASTGLQAVTMILASVTQGKPFKVVLMDIEMPEMDGLTATREIRTLEERGVLPKSLVIVGCSAYSSEEDKQQALASGMNHYLEKPISRTGLFDLVTANC